MVAVPMIITVSGFGALDGIVESAFVMVLYAHAPAAAPPAVPLPVAALSLPLIGSTKIVDPAGSHAAHEFDRQTLCGPGQSLLWQQLPATQLFVPGIAVAQQKSAGFAVQV
jgi:hypothetical protein